MDRRKTLPFCGVLFAAGALRNAVRALLVCFLSRSLALYILVLLLVLFFGFGNDAFKGFVDSLPVFGDHALRRFYLTWNV